MSGSINNLNNRNAQGPALSDYRAIVDTSKYLDGDIRLNSKEKLEKVNYGSGFANVMTLGLSNRRVRALPDQNARSREAFWNALTFSNEAKSIPYKELAKIAESLGLSKNEDGVYKANAENAKPLSRREIKYILEKFDKVTPDQKKEGETYIGGKRGLHLTENQFKGIFDQIENRGLVKHFLPKCVGNVDKATLDLYAKVAGNLIKECRRKFAAGGVSDGLFEKLFSDGMDVDQVTKRLIKYVSSDELRELDFSPDTPVSAKVISKEARKQIDKYYTKIELEGKERIGQLSKTDASFANSASNVTKDGACRFVSELLFNSDTAQADKAGFEGGHRIVNILMKDIDTFRELCEAAAGGSQDKFNSVLKMLGEIDQALKPAFTKMIQTISSKCFGGNIPQDAETFRLKCVANLDKILAAVTGSKLEKALDAAAIGYLDDINIEVADGVDKKGIVAYVNELLNSYMKGAENPYAMPSEVIVKDIIDAVKQNKKFATVPDDPVMKDLINAAAKSRIISHNTGHSALMIRLGRALDLYEGETVKPQFSTLAATMSASLKHGVAAQSLRRMLAAGFRFAEGKKFNQNRILMELGPMSHKLLQGVNVEHTDPDLQTTLGYIRGKLPRMDVNMVKAQLVSYLSEQMNADLDKIETITIKESVGAASIAELVKAEVKYKDRPDPVVVAVKILRPEVKAKFEAERDGVLADLQAQREAIKSNTESEKYKALSTSINEVNSLASTVGKEFNFKTEFRSAIKSYAALLGRGEGADQDIKSMGLVLKDPDKLGDFNDALCRWEDTQFVLQNERHKTCTYDDVIDYLAGIYLIEASDSCLIAKNVPGQTVDDLTKSFRDERIKTVPETGISSNTGSENSGRSEKFEKLEKSYPDLVTVNKLLLRLARESIGTLMKGHPPMLHLDMHGSNLMTDGTSVTEIDFGKEFNIDDSERDEYRKLLSLFANPNATDVVGTLKGVIENLLNAEMGKCGDEDPNELARKNCIKETLASNSFKQIFTDYGDEYNSAVNDLEGKHGGDKAGKEIALKNIDLIVRLSDKMKEAGLYVPTGLVDFLETFKKLNNAQQSIHDEIVKYNQAKEMYKNGFAITSTLKDVSKILEDFANSDGKYLDLTNEIINKAKELQKKVKELMDTKCDTDILIFKKNLDGFKNAFVGWETSVKEKFGEEGLASMEVKKIRNKLDELLAKDFLKPSEDGTGYTEDTSAAVKASGIRGTAQGNTSQTFMDIFEVIGDALAKISEGQPVEKRTEASGKAA